MLLFMLLLLTSWIDYVDKTIIGGGKCRSIHLLIAIIALINNVYPATHSFFQNETGSSESFRELSAVLEIVKYVYYPHIQSGSGKGWRIRKIYFISKFPCGIIKISFQAGIT